MSRFDNTPGDYALDPPAADLEEEIEPRYEMRDVGDGGGEPFEGSYEELADWFIDPARLIEAGVASLALGASTTVEGVVQIRRIL